MNQERNRFCSVYQLPVELLTYILMLACNHPGRPTMSDVALFKRVSKYFRDIIDATAGFWVDIRIGHPLAQTTLAKSLGLPIDISTPMQEGKRLSAFMGVGDPLVEGIVANSARWRSFRFAGHPTAAETELLHCATPQLKHLYLDFQSIRHGTPSSGQPSIDPGEGQPLRDLCLNSVRLPWSSPRLRQLKTLQLYNIEAPPSRAELYLLLASSTQLEQLVLSTFGWDSTPELPALGSAKPIIFPHLEEITLYDLYWRLTDFLCSVIRAPNVKSIMMGTLSLERFYLQDQLWAPFHDTVEGCMDEIACIDIEIDSDRGVIEIRTEPSFGALLCPSPQRWNSEITRSFDIDCAGEVVLLDFLVLAEFLAEKAGGVDVRLTLIRSDSDSSDAEVDVLLRGLTALKSITDLDIASFQAGAQIVRHLSVEHEDEMGVRTWVCPWLTKLNVEDVPDIDQDDWKALLEARGPRRTSSGMDLPARITELQENVEEMRRKSMMI